jgi:uncharacterized protein YjbI with pentapeptide repeats
LKGCESGLQPRFQCRGCNLTGASLRRTDLRWSDFSNLTGADLQDADLTGSALEEADFTGMVMENMDATWFRNAVNLPIHLQKRLNQ